MQDDVRTDCAYFITIKSVSVTNKYYSSTLHEYDVLINEGVDEDPTQVQHTIYPQQERYGSNMYHCMFVSKRAYYVALLFHRFV